jgi:hypothetical protein
MDKPGQLVCLKAHLAIVDAINHFKDVNDSYPDQVIIYRDAGSGTKLNALKTIEVLQIEQAVKQLNEEIRLMYVVV